MYKDCRDAEYGGYLPIELDLKKEYYSKHIVNRYNSARTAIYAALYAHRPQKIYVPYYICDSVISVLRELEIPIERYHITTNLEIEQSFRVMPNEIVLVVNYFGLKESYIKSIETHFSSLLIDNTQAFFAEPIIRNGVYNVYSCRKFVGVPDGAYLITAEQDVEQFDIGFSYERYIPLLKARECGTNSGYNLNLQNEDMLSKEKSGMSNLTRLFLKSVNYQSIKTKRKDNFSAIHRFLSQKNRLLLDLANNVPYVYPYWVTEGTGKKVKEKLLQKHIYIPTLWKECQTVQLSRHLEGELSNDLICLPIDQRYDIKEIATLAQMILDVEEQK